MMVDYCSAACQKHHWSAGSHRRRCETMPTTHLHRVDDIVGDRRPEQLADGIWRAYGQTHEAPGRSRIGAPVEVGEKKDETEDFEETLVQSVSWLSEFSGRLTTMDILRRLQKEDDSEKIVQFSTAMDDLAKLDDLPPASRQRQFKSRFCSLQETLGEMLRYMSELLGSVIAGQRAVVERFGFRFDTWWPSVQTLLAAGTALLQQCFAGVQRTVRAVPAALVYLFQRMRRAMTHFAGTVRGLYESVGKVLFRMTESIVSVYHQTATPIGQRVEQLALYVGGTYQLSRLAVAQTGATVANVVQDGLRERVRNFFKMVYNSESRTAQLLAWLLRQKWFTPLVRGLGSIVESVLDVRSLLALCNMSLDRIAALGLRAVRSLVGSAFVNYVVPWFMVYAQAATVNLVQAAIPRDYQGSSADVFSVIQPVAPGSPSLGGRAGRPSEGLKSAREQGEEFLRLVQGFYRVSPYGTEERRDLIREMLEDLTAADGVRPRSYLDRIRQSASGDGVAIAREIKDDLSRRMWRVTGLAARMRRAENEEKRAEVVRTLLDDADARTLFEHVTGEADLIDFLLRGMGQREFQSFRRIGVLLDLALALIDIVPASLVEAAFSRTSSPRSARERVSDARAKIGAFAGTRKQRLENLLLNKLTTLNELELVLKDVDDLFRQAAEGSFPKAYVDLFQVSTIGGPSTRRSADDINETIRNTLWKERQRLSALVTFVKSASLRTRVLETERERERLAAQQSYQQLITSLVYLGLVSILFWTIYEITTFYEEYEQSILDAVAKQKILDGKNPIYANIVRAGSPTMIQRHQSASSRNVLTATVGRLTGAGSTAAERIAGVLGLSAPPGASAAGTDASPSSLRMREIQNDALATTARDSYAVGGIDDQPVDFPMLKLEDGEIPLLGSAVELPSIPITQPEKLHETVRFITSDILDPLYKEKLRSYYDTLASPNAVLGEAEKRRIYQEFDSLASKGYGFFARGIDLNQTLTEWSAGRYDPETSGKGFFQNLKDWFGSWVDTTGLQTRVSLDDLDAIARGTKKQVFGGQPPGGSPQDADDANVLTRPKTFRLGLQALNKLNDPLFRLSSSAHDVLEKQFWFVLMMYQVNQDMLGEDHLDDFAKEISKDVVRESESMLETTRRVIFDMFGYQSSNAAIETLKYGSFKFKTALATSPAIRTSIVALMLGYGFLTFLNHFYYSPGLVGTKFYNAVTTSLLRMFTGSLKVVLSFVVLVFISDMNLLLQATAFTVTVAGFVLTDVDLVRNLFLKYLPSGVGQLAVVALPVSVDIMRRFKDRIVEYQKTDSHVPDLELMNEFSDFFTGLGEREKTDWYNQYRTIVLNLETTAQTNDAADAADAADDADDDETEEEEEEESGFI